MGKTDIMARIFKERTITIDMFGFAFYRPFTYKMVTHARVFSLFPKSSITDRQGLFLANAFHFLHKKFGYDNMCSWAKIKDETICLPITQEGQIDFNFMEGFIAELEAYLLATGLKDTTLTPQESQALKDFADSNGGGAKYKIGELFAKIKVNSLGYKTSELPSEAKIGFELPALTAGIQNQGLNNFVPKGGDATILQNVISISANGANTGATFYQSKDFTILQDAYAIRWIYTDDTLSDNHHLYLTACISKRIYGYYEWTNKAGWERVKQETIHLPITEDGQIDFNFMENFISAIQKLVIQDVVLYAEQKIQATREAAKLI